MCGAIAPPKGVPLTDDVKDAPLLARPLHHGAGCKKLACSLYWRADFGRGGDAQIYGSTPKTAIGSGGNSLRSSWSSCRTIGESSAPRAAMMPENGYDFRGVARL